MAVVSWFVSNERRIRTEEGHREGIGAEGERDGRERGERERGKF